MTDGVVVVRRPLGREQKPGPRTWADFDRPDRGHVGGALNRGAWRGFVRHVVASPARFLLDAIAVLSAMCIGALLARLKIF